MGEHSGRATLASVIGEEGLERALGEDGELEAVELVTVDEDGWPHTALLSVGEVLQLDDDRLALCLWRGSATTGNLARDGRALLVATTAGAVVKARLATRPLGELIVGDRQFESFIATITSVTGDAVGYAEVLGGIRFRLEDAGAVVRRWRAQREALRERATSSR